MPIDVLVLGAGIVGVSVAIHQVERGRSVILVDRRAPGEETSFGNAGLIQRDPNALIVAYVRYLESIGGQVATADAMRLERPASGRGWRLPPTIGTVELSEVVLALGPWADTVARPLGCATRRARRRRTSCHGGCADRAKGGRAALDGRSTVHARHDADPRTRSPRSGTLVRPRPRPSRHDARTSYGTTACGANDGRSPGD